MIGTSSMEYIKKQVKTMKRLGKMIAIANGICKQPKKGRGPIFGKYAGFSHT